MSYAAVVGPEAMSPFLALDVQAQEAVLDLLDQLADEGRSLTPIQQFHQVVVTEASWRTDAYLLIDVNHARRAVTLLTVGWDKTRL